MFRFAILLILAGFLSACGGPGGNIGSGARSSFEFEANDERAVVIFGLRSTEPVPRDGLIRLHEAWSVTWARFDPETETFANRSNRFERRKNSIEARRRLCIKLNQSACPGDQLDTAYGVAVVRPGSYMLYSLYRESEDSMLFTSPSPSRVFKNGIADNLKSGAVPHFQVAAGEIAYIGDYTFSVTEWPARLVSVERDDKAVKKLMAGYPDMTGPIHYRGPTLDGQSNDLDVRRGDGSTTTIN